MQINPADNVQIQRLSNPVRAMEQRLGSLPFSAELARQTRNPSAHEIQQEVKNDPERRKLYEASQEFQAIFLNQMLGAMRRTVNKDNDILNGGRTQEIFEDFLYDEYSKSMSKQPGFTLADEIYKQLSAHMGPAQPGEQTPSVSTEQLANPLSR